MPIYSRLHVCSFNHMSNQNTPGKQFQSLVVSKWKPLAKTSLLNLGMVVENPCNWPQQEVEVDLSCG